MRGVKLIIPAIILLAVVVFQSLFVVQETIERARLSVEKMVAIGR